MTIEYTSELIFGGAILTLLCVLASVVSRRLGAPILLVFLILGMLAGENGPGGIKFSDVGLAFMFGSLALAIIIFDGGLGARKTTFRVALRPAMVLATLGVLITAGITGAATHWILGLPWLESLLIGAIVGSTDAAAVFGLLRMAGFELKERISATVEIESGTNDPMAIFLTITLAQLLVSKDTNPGLTVLIEFVRQMGLGLVLGSAGGYLIVRILRIINLQAAMYPLFVLAGAMSVFGVTNLIGGSGFLAIYIVGMMVGNSSLPYGNDIHRFHHGIAWLCQIGMFLMLGLLVTPAKLLPLFVPAIAIVLVLNFVARPVAVGISLLPFHFPWREQVFIGWCGLRGAVPIILALFPTLAGVEGSGDYFELVFFVVLISLVLQGWTIAPVAKWLGLELPPSLRDPEHLSLKVPDGHDKELLIYQVAKNSAVVNTAVRHLHLDEGAQLAGIIRKGIMLTDPQQANIAEGDQVLLLAMSGATLSAGRLFAPAAPETRLEENVFFGSFSIQPDAGLGDLAQLYGFDLPPELHPLTVEQYFMREFHGKPVVGDSVQLGPVQCVVKELQDGQIIAVGLKM